MLSSPSPLPFAAQRSKVDDACDESPVAASWLLFVVSLVQALGTLPE